MEKRRKIRQALQDENEDDIQRRIKETEDQIRRITTWADAKDIWARFQQVANSENTASTQAMWKLKKRNYFQT